MKHSKKKGDNAPVPDQSSMGSANDYAPEGSVSQGDGQGADPGFSGSSDTAADTAADPAADTRAATGAAEAGAAATSRAEPDSGTERDRYLRLSAEYDNYRKRSAKE
ncbi:MAG TPA: hypothetical protein VF836_12655, partial [Gemmatimonadaceae bacterium]